MEEKKRACEGEEGEEEEEEVKEEEKEVFSPTHLLKEMGDGGWEMQDTR